MIGAACLNEIGGYKCQCRRGFVMNSDQTECIPKQPIHKNGLRHSLQVRLIASVSSLQCLPFYNFLDYTLYFRIQIVPLWRKN